MGNFVSTVNTLSDTCHRHTLSAVVRDQVELIAVADVAVNDSAGLDVVSGASFLDEQTGRATAAHQHVQHFRLRALVQLCDGAVDLFDVIGDLYEVRLAFSLRNYLSARTTCCRAPSLAPLLYKTKRPGYRLFFALKASKPRSIMLCNDGMLFAFSPT